jgi:hypothetical protein
MLGPYSLRRSSGAIGETLFPNVGLTWTDHPDSFRGGGRHLLASSLLPQFDEARPYAFANLAKASL